MSEIPLNSKIIHDKNNIQDPERYKILKLNRNMNLIDIKRHLIGFIESEETNRTIYIGIDPGENIGLAIIQKNHVIATNLVLSIENMIKWIKTHIFNLRRENIIFRVGNGVKKHREIVKILYREFGNKIELVDESNSSIKNSNTNTIHEQSAIIIAGRKGLEINLDRNLGRKNKRL